MKIIDGVRHVAHLHHDIMHVRTVFFIALFVATVHMLLRNGCNFDQWVFPLVCNGREDFADFSQFGLLDNKLLMFIFLKLNGTQFFLTLDTLINVVNKSKNQKNEKRGDKKNSINELAMFIKECQWCIH